MAHESEIEELGRRSTEDAEGIDPSRGRRELRAIRKSYDSDEDSSSRNGQGLKCIKLPMRDQIALLRALEKDDYKTVGEIQRRTMCGPAQMDVLRESVDFYLRSRWPTFSPRYRDNLMKLVNGGRGVGDGKTLASEIALQQERNAREDL